VVSYSGGAVSLSSVQTLYQAGQYDDIVPLFFSGDDTISGSVFADVLLGMEGSDAVKGNGGNDSLEGGAGTDSLSGGGGKDRIAGGTGSDVLGGGGGADTFVFDAALGPDNIDRIKNFTIDLDRIELSTAVFTGLGAGGSLDPANFATDVATMASHHIIYKSATGFLLYDADGAGGADAVRFAKIGAGLALDAGDFACA
jgi:Ca2+-binding RTX toxin-like protein